MLVTAVMLEQQVTKNFGAATLNSDSDLEIRREFSRKNTAGPDRQAGHNS